jgi:hypothetical protein
MLSPDRQYYWDGARWNSAMTPDGAWRWSGSAWVPARRTPGMTTQLAIAVAAGVIAALLLGGVGLAFLVRFANTQQPALQAGLGAACTAATDRAGSHLRSGDVLCGRRLGTAYILADCAAGHGPPVGMDADQLGANDKQGKPTTVIVDSQGCALTTPTAGEIRISSSDYQPPDLVVVDDFVPPARVGGVGLQLACRTSGCIDVGVYADGTYYLDEYESASDTWSHITSGALPIQTLGFRVGSVNRLVMRYDGSLVEVFLNGYLVTRGTPKNAQISGYVGFYVDGRDGTEALTVHMLQLDAFGAA